MCLNVRACVRECCFFVLLSALRVSDLCMPCHGGGIVCIISANNGGRKRIFFHPLHPAIVRLLLHILLAPLLLSSEMTPCLENVLGVGWRGECVSE